jgi:hypothetical protein
VARSESRCAALTSEPFRSFEDSVSILILSLMTALPAAKMVSRQFPPALGFRLVQHRLGLAAVTGRFFKSLPAH